ALPGSERWRYCRPMVPGSGPLSNLARLAHPTGIDAAEWIGEQAGRLRQDAGQLARLIGESGQEPAVLVVDQFEELFTLCPDEEARRAFVGNLIGLAEAPGARHTVILTMRVDFEGYTAWLPALRERFAGAQARVTPL